MHFGGNASHATGQDLTRFRRELGKKFRVQEIDLVNGNIVATARHRAVATTKTNTAFDSLRFCRHSKNDWGKPEGIRLAHFAVKSAALQERIILNLFQTVRRTQALFVTRGDVAGRRLSFGFGLGAFEDDDVSRHDEYKFREKGFYTIPRLRQEKL